MTAKLGVSFNGYHTLRDWGLHWSDLSIDAPQPITSYISIPGRRTKIDITESLYGEVTYENRKLQFDFWMQGSREYWKQMFSKIQNAIHGQRVKVVLDIDPSSYWMGRATVSSKIESNNPGMGFFTITVDAEPYKYSLTETSEPWEWDPFNFETDSIGRYEGVSVPAGETVTINVNGPSIPVRPTVKATKTISLKVDDSTYEIAGGTAVQIRERAGKKTFEFTNAGAEESAVTVLFRGESL